MRAQDIKSSIDVTVDCISAPKNFLNAATRGTAAALPFMVAAQGFLTFGAGAYTGITSLQELRTATTTSNRPGIARGVAGSCIGVTQMTVGSAAATYGLGTLAHSAAAIGASVVINPALLAMYSSFIARSSLALHYVRDFEQQFANAELTGTRKQFLLREWTHNPAHLKKVVGEECFAEIQKLASGQPVNLTALSQKITQELRKQKITHGAVIALCLLGITATLTGMAFIGSCPELSHLLFGIGAVLWLFVDYPPLHRKVQNIIINGLEGKGPIPYNGSQFLKPLTL